MILDILIVLWILGGFIHAGILKGYEIVERKSDKNFLGFFVAFILSWYGIGLWIGGIFYGDGD